MAEGMLAVDEVTTKTSPDLTLVHTNAENATPPLVSIGMPVYNGADYLREAIDSVLSQTFTNFELIITDNCSTDATSEICLDFAARDPRVRYQRNEVNIGGPANFNLLVEMARGKYFKWVAHDDKILPEFLAECVEILEQKPNVVMAYARAQCIGAEGELLHSYERATLTDEWSSRATDRFRRFINEIAHNHSITVPVYVFGVVRTAELRKTHLIRRFISGDNNLVAEMLLLGQVHEVQKPLSLIRYHPGSSGWIPSWNARRLQRFYRPDGSNLVQRISSLGYRQYFEYYRSILQAEVGAIDKLIMCKDNTLGILKRALARVHLLRRRIKDKEEIVTPWQRY